MVSFSKICVVVVSGLAGKVSADFNATNITDPIHNFNLDVLKNMTNSTHTNVTNGTDLYPGHGNYTNITYSYDNSALNRTLSETFFPDAYNATVSASSTDNGMNSTFGANKFNVNYSGPWSGKPTNSTLADSFHGNSSFIEQSDEAYNGTFNGTDLTFRPIDSTVEREGAWRAGGDRISSGVSAMFDDGVRDR